MDGSADAQEISFSYKGTDYMIDLGEKSQAKLDKALAPFLGKATKVRGRKKATSSASGRKDLATIRAWAAEQGIEVSERGRISKAVLDQYDAGN